MKTLFDQTHASQLSEIQHIGCVKSESRELRHIGSGQSEKPSIHHIGCGILADLTEAVEQVDAERGFCIDLKLGVLAYQDTGQMDGYVRLWDESGKQPEDNPTIGIILCSEKSETIARYSVLADSQQLFASRYRLHLPTEQELAAELRREVQNLAKLDEKEGVLK